MTKSISHDIVFKGRCVGEYDFITFHYLFFFVAERKNIDIFKQYKCGVYTYGMFKLAITLTK